MGRLSSKLRDGRSAIGNKLAPPYAWIYMDEEETEEWQPLVWYIYIYIWNHSEDEFNKFLENLNKFNSNLKFTH